MEEQLYRYRARITRVYDGDTCTADVDLGMGVWVHGEKIRLARIDAPELRGEQRVAGLAARDFLRERIHGRDVIIATQKDKKGKYGRYIGDIWVVDASGGMINVNDELVKAGHASYVEY